MESNPAFSLSDFLPLPPWRCGEDLIVVDGSLIAQSNFGFVLDYIRQGLAIVNAGLKTAIAGLDPDQQKKLDKAPMLVSDLLKELDEFVTYKRKIYPK